MACLTTTIVPLLFSVVMRKTSVALMSSYLVLVLLFLAPPAVETFARVFYPDAPLTRLVVQCTLVSPFSATFNLPLSLGQTDPAKMAIVGHWPVYLGFMACYGAVNGILVAAIVWLFNMRRRVSV